MRHSRHRHKFLGGCRVNRHAVVQVRLCGAHLQRHAKPLQNLIARHPEQMYANDALVITLANDLVDSLDAFRRVGARRHVVHVCKLRLVHLQRVVWVLVTCLLLRQTHSANWCRMRKHDGTNVRVIQVSLIVLGRSEQPIRQLTASGNSNGSQVHWSSHITQRVHTIN